MAALPHRPRNRRFLWIAAALLAFLIAAYFIFGGGKDKAGGPGGPGGPMQPASVTAIKVAAADIPLSFEYSGRATGAREVEIRARVSGILVKRTYVEGQAVKAGAVLFKIDPAPFEASFASSQARSTQAARDWDRAEALYKEKALSAREYDEARAARDQSQAELKTARINLGYTTVTAPISGVTSREGLSEGSLVTADTSLLTRLTQLDPIYVYFAAPDTDALLQRRSVAEGKFVLPADGKLTAELHFVDGRVYPRPGTVDFTDSIIDAATGTVRARAVVPNPDNALLPGQFVRLTVKGLTRKNAVAIPDQAVMQGPQGTFVYLVDKDSKATPQPVTLGLLSGRNRIIESGLKDGDEVITEGMIKVKPGNLVNAQPPEEKKAEPAEEKKL